VNLLIVMPYVKAVLGTGEFIDFRGKHLERGLYVKRPDEQELVFVHQNDDRK
jgi:hypothetical protein